jgi:hypothetical protein
LEEVSGQDVVVEIVVWEGLVDYVEGVTVLEGSEQKIDFSFLKFDFSLFLKIVSFSHINSKKFKSEVLSFHLISKVSEQTQSENFKKCKRQLNYLHFITKYLVDLKYLKKINMSKFMCICDLHHSIIQEYKLCASCTLKSAVCFKGCPNAEKPHKFINHEGIKAR